MEGAVLEHRAKVHTARDNWLVIHWSVEIDDAVSATAFAVNDFITQYNLAVEILSCEGPSAIVVILSEPTELSIHHHRGCPHQHRCSPAEDQRLIVSDVFCAIGKDGPLAG